MPQAPSVDGLIQALESQRATLGDAAVDFAIAALREKALARGAEAAAPKLRQVSILFCDIVESTSMLEDLPAEEALAVVGEALQRFASIVVEHGGRVLRFTGDGLKAAFGTEQAREDDAERALRSGLAILAAASEHAARLRSELAIERFGVRAGIHTGPVVLGVGPEADKTAMGHAVHIAARLEQSAPVGRLRISHPTWLLVRGRFEVEAQPPLAVKGSEEPLATYLVSREVPRASAWLAGRGLEGVLTPLVGRDPELEQLLATVARARETATTQLATVIGDAGLGKTRLLRELEPRLPPGSTLLAQSRPASVLQPYGLVRDLVSRWLGIADDESAAGARARLVDGLAPLCGENGEIEAERVGHLIGFSLPDAPYLRGVQGRELRERGFRALRQALAELARRASPGPLVLLLDDLHWSDDGSLDFVEELAQVEAPIAVIGFARPALEERRPAWLDGVADRLTARLTPLDAEHGKSLAAALLARMSDVPEALRRLLVSRADGNPFFMEELVRMLIDDGVIDAAADGWRLRSDQLAGLRVPETLVGVLQARLDALPTADLAALQRASVIGPVFWDQALSAIDPEAAAALPALERRSLVVRRSESAFEQCVEYGFFHQILHDVTYGTVPKAPRRDGHARAARWLAARVGERAGEFLAVTAEHYERAGLSSEALDYYERATEDALRRCVHEPVWIYAGRALAQPALADDHERRYTIQVKRHYAADRQGDTERRAQALAELVALAEESGMDSLRADALSVRALDADREGRHAEAKALAAEVVPLAEQTDSRSAATMAHGLLAWLAVTERDFEVAYPHIEKGILWARRTAELPRARGGYAGYELQIRMIAIEAWILQDRLVDAAAELDRALEILGTGDPLDRFSLLSRRAMVERELGDLETAEQVVREALAHTVEIDVPRLRAHALMQLSELAEVRGDAIAQRDLAAEAIAVASACKSEDDLMGAQAREASAWAALGETARARERLESLLARHRAEANLMGQRSTLVRLAEIDLAAGDLPAALQRIDELLANEGHDALTPEAHHAALRVLREAGDPRAATLLDALAERLRRLLEQVPDAAVRERIVRTLPHWRDVHRAAREQGRSC